MNIHTHIYFKHTYSLHLCGECGVAEELAGEDSGRPLLVGGGLTESANLAAIGETSSGWVVRCCGAGAECWRARVQPPPVGRFRGRLRVDFCFLSWSLFNLLVGDENSGRKWILQIANFPMSHYVRLLVGWLFGL